MTRPDEPGEAPLDLLVLGSGVAGLSAAVRAAGTHHMRVGVLTKGELAQSTTRWAQGGVAAVLGEDPDSTDLHLADTLAAGAGLCDGDAVRVLVDEGPGRVNELIALGAMFDRDDQGRLELAREGGHSLARVVHAGGAATGAEIERALVEAVRQTVAAVHENAFAVDLLVGDGQCRGVVARDADGAIRVVEAANVLLATGGAGQLYSVTTNPVEVTGDGIAMALRAGAAVADVEFVQFHPTPLHHPEMPRPLLSEALRGHGALIRDTHGQRFVDELQPRDVVARAITRRMLDQGVDHLWLDATGLEDFDGRFPTISAALTRVGLDPTTDWLPIAPAAHHLSGGVVTDLDGASSVDGLWAAGEASCSGVHGANRLASNALLEGMVFGARVVEAIEGGQHTAHPTGAMRSVLAARQGDGGAHDDGVVIGGLAVEGWSPLRGPVLTSTQPAEPAGRSEPVEAASAQAGAVDRARRDRAELARAMTEGAGVLRDADSLAATAQVADRLGAALPTGTEPAVCELANLLELARALLAAASQRTESRGSHTRADFPETDPAFRRRIVLDVVAGPGGPGRRARGRSPMSALEAPRGAVVEAVRRALAEDLTPLGDLTSALVPPELAAVAAVVVRGSGVVAGIACATEAFAQVDPAVSVRWSAADGDLISSGTSIGQVSGPLASILTAERTALNFLGHLSGIATLTRRFVVVAAAAGDTRIWDTRKTTPGLRSLEKAAVRAGGGANHRGNLSDWILLKDNHLARLGLAQAVAEARRRWPARTVHVECDTIEQLDQALEAGADAVLLDNMTPELVLEAVARADEHVATVGGRRPLLEVSGGITLETVTRYVGLGADLISVGGLTNSAPVLDIGLDIDPVVDAGSSSAPRADPDPDPGTRS